MKFFLLFISLNLYAVQPDQKKLPIWLSPLEMGRKPVYAPTTSAPKGPIHSLAEWETSSAVMTLWTNPSLVKELSKRGPVKLFADERNDQDWWSQWLQSNQIPDAGISYYVTPTDSMGIRDYGPWFILDGDSKFGSIDTKYNRPRPLDDVVPIYIAKMLKIPYYQPGLVHTGGNYYNDAMGNAFSSTLVYSENTSITKKEIDLRMLNYLGIEKYSTSKLAPQITIQHLDTFGKLVSPDTWVFSDFPAGSPYKEDSDQMANLLKTLVSPYGTPYKIYRLKMVEMSRQSYRAYINSFISNQALYFPAYGDEIDEEVSAIYQRALPGYEIVPVDAGGTEWGDSVHCRTRNLLTNKSVFIFPKIQVQGNSIIINAEVIPSQDALIEAAPIIHWSINGLQQSDLKMENMSTKLFSKTLSALSSKDKIKLWISAVDSNGYKKTEPHAAPNKQIEYQIQE